MSRKNSYSFQEFVSAVLVLEALDNYAAVSKAGEREHVIRHAENVVHDADHAAWKLMGEERSDELIEKIANVAVNR